MPKILDNVKADLISHTRKLLQEKGYGAVSMRAVAFECHIAPGTIYNYFSSKDEMIAACMSEDWGNTLDSMKGLVGRFRSIKEVISAIYESIVEYTGSHYRLFEDPEAVESYRISSKKYHGMLIEQLTEILDAPCRSNARHYTEGLAEFIAEAVLERAVRGYDFEAFYEIIGQFF